MSTESKLPLNWPKPDRKTTALEIQLGELFDMSPSDVLIIKALSHGMGVAEAADIFGWERLGVITALKRLRRLWKAKNNAHLIAKLFREGIIS